MSTAHELKLQPFSFGIPLSRYSGSLCALSHPWHALPSDIAGLSTNK